MQTDDTIAAISTPAGTGGIGIIRISGDKAFEIAEKIFIGKKDFSNIKSHTIKYGKIIDPSAGEIIDEVLISKMRKPHTFTREDMVEINCHGGMTVLRNVLELVIREGARLAEPGEFTKRAFLNGRIDLSQAEAVIDIINSKTKESSKAAIEQLEGKLSRRLKEIRKKLISLIANIEVNIEYPEYDIEEITLEETCSTIHETYYELENLIKSFEKGRIIKEGIKAVIVGKPNVGKSSLLNELTGKDRAIVTDIPGTTRDVIEDYINIKGIPMRILDTAGIRETEDPVEKIGVQKTEKEILAADLVILMIDVRTGISNEDLEMVQKAKDKKIIVLINKIDLVEEKECNKTENDIKNKLEGIETVKVSLLKGTGVEELTDKIYKLFVGGEINYSNEIIITNIRHKNLMEKAKICMKEALDGCRSGLPLDIISIDISRGADYLGQITGETVSEDVLHEIFSRFCLGK
ncbi:MAG TPA: tRNA uridine-5-carboxymethylaminomethyl(34) synthesis GTPase MnmE [Clostridiaceae bacterium]|nr:tRNA uridine-5-carboxymethylaminomethyl(34) synthesis GTPase MnmE [Clostridiaceae bacterium]